MKETLKELLAAGKTAQVITQLQQVTQQDADLQNMVLLLSARFATLERENRFGVVVDAATLNMERNRINAALSHVIDEFADVNPPPTTHKSDVEDSKSPKTVIQNAEKIYNIDRIDNANFS